MIIQVSNWFYRSIHFLEILPRYAESDNDRVQQWVWSEPDSDLFTWVKLQTDIKGDDSQNSYYYYIQTSDQSNKMRMDGL